jgi:chemotaxis protein CheZ
MSVNRKRFRVEQAILGDAPIEMPMGADVDVGPMHREIMNELRAIRAQMAAPVRSQTPEALQDAANRELAETQSLLDTYRAQIEQCEAWIELDLIHDAINRTKREIAVLHGKASPTDQGHGGRRGRGTNTPPSRSWKRPRSIDKPRAPCQNTSLDQQKILSEEISERVVSIFEACNFRISLASASQGDER